MMLVFLPTLIRMFLHLPKKMLEWRQKPEIIGTGLDVIAYLWRKHNLFGILTETGSSKPRCTSTANSQVPADSSAVGHSLLVVFPWIYFLSFFFSFLFKAVGVDGVRKLEIQLEIVYIFFQNISYQDQINTVGGNSLLMRFTCTCIFVIAYVQKKGNSGSLPSMQFLFQK